ncbi:MAG: PIN domain-containing protein [Deltaproteobacteria bacterium]
MVSIDSSVWIEFFRAKNQAVVTELRRLLDADSVALPAPVRLELISGASRSDATRLSRLLSALPLLIPAPALWVKLDTWVEKGKKSGQRFGSMDLLIAGIADDHETAVWSLDADFERMARLGLIRLHGVA